MRPAKSCFLGGFAIVLTAAFACAVVPRAFADALPSTPSAPAEQKKTEKLPLHGEVTVLPMRYIYVTHNEDRFRADRWTRDGFAGGVKELEVYYETPEKVSVWMEGRGILDQDEAMTRNDYFGSVLIKKEDLGFVDVEFKEFPKYYDTRGGIYHPFQFFSGSNIDRELELDIYMLRIATGLTLKGWPEIELEYEREIKEGAKSRTTWGSALENGVTRKIVPSWQEIDEMVNVFAIKAKHEVRKFELHGEQHWEYVKSVNKRYEKNLGTTPDYNLQIQEPDSRMMTSTVGADRWFWKEKAFTSLAYRFARIRNSEKENLTERNGFFQLQSFSNNAEQRFNARSDVHMDSHTAVSSQMVNPWPWLSVHNKAKAELWRARGNSTYPYDLSATGATGIPDGIIDQTVFSDNKNKTWRVGEDLSIRFKKIPRTALYTEFSVEEARNRLNENRWSRAEQATLAAARYAVGENFSRRTISNMLRTVATAGMNASPWNFLNATAQLRHRYDNTNFHDKRETVFSSAFFDEYSSETAELETRATLRPCNWFRSSARYILRDVDYMTRVQYQEWRESGVLGDTYVLDASVTPRNDLSLTGSFTRENLAAKTAATADPTGIIPLPGFNSDVDTWLFSLDYAPKSNVSLISTVSYSRANNFNDFTNFGMPLGADYDRVGVTLGVKWQFQHNVTVEPIYEFYHYGPDERADGSGYTANVVGLEVSAPWG